MTHRIRPLVEISVYASKQFGELGRIGFSRRGGWHELGTLCKIDILGDLITVLHEKRDKLREQYHKEITRDRSKTRQATLPQGMPSE